MRGDGVGFPQLNLSAYHVDNDRRTSPERERQNGASIRPCVCVQHVNTARRAPMCVSKAEHSWWRRKVKYSREEEKKEIKTSSSLIQDAIAFVDDSSLSQISPRLVSPGTLFYLSSKDIYIQLFFSSAQQLAIHLKLLASSFLTNQRRPKYIDISGSLLNYQQSYYSSSFVRVRHCYVMYYNYCTANRNEANNSATNKR